MIRYPGEDCSQDEDCIKVPGDHATGKCQGSINKTCSGNGEFLNCTNHASCLKGLYCDNGWCTKQKGFNSTCSSSYECINSLLCNERICSFAPYSLNVGTRLHDYEDFKDQKCKYGLAIQGIDPS
jgi:hypothetical protein